MTAPDPESGEPFLCNGAFSEVSTLPGASFAAGSACEISDVVDVPVSCGLEARFGGVDSSGSSRNHGKSCAFSYPGPHQPIILATSLSASNRSVCFADGDNLRDRQDRLALPDPR